MQIDPRMQQAAVANLESQRVARQADLLYARQQATRMKTLLEAGAASQAELEQAQSALATGEAQLKAIEEQIRQQRVALGYHTVTAPVAGIVGDIPVREGDRVTHSTELTTIDQNAGLEVYLNVPVQEAAKLKVGMPVHLVDDRGGLISTETLSFVSPSVDPATQSVLAKAALNPLSGSSPFRTEQIVRARIVWTEPPR
jgi:RND family efflux transporter MFP subunit